MNGMQRTSGCSRSGWLPTRQHLLRSPYRADGGGRMPRRGRLGLATRHSSFIEAYRYNWDPCRAAAEDVVACEEPPDCPNRASPQRTFPNGKKPPEIASE